MSDDEDGKDKPAGGGSGARSERLARALRANLRRRKVQARRRAESSCGASEDKGD